MEARNVDEYLYFHPHLPDVLITLPQPLRGEQDLDLHKLASAIACAETSCGTTGSAIYHKNCCGIMVFWDDKDGHHRRPKDFASYEDSLTATAALWAKSYKEFPDMKIAVKWTGNDHPADWLATVKAAYATL